MTCFPEAALSESNTSIIQECSNPWELAYRQQFHHASVGQMFTGILHNLNGVNQAFSLQSSLLRSMFSKADDLLDKIKNANGDGCDQDIEALQSLLSQRSLMVDQMEIKLEQGQNILARCHSLTSLYSFEPDKEIYLNRIIQYELDILTSFSFFKHGVTKKVTLADDIPAISRFHIELHNIIYVILLNAIEALHGVDQPELTVNSYYKDNKIFVEIINKCDGAWLDDTVDIFTPFYSTKVGHAGVGLYLADTFIKKIGGRIDAAFINGETCFTISLPTLID